MNHATPISIPIRLSRLANHLGASIYPFDDSTENRTSSALPDPELHGIHHDSRQVTPGDLFVARPGEHVNGWDYANAAIHQGAVAILAESLPHDSFANVPVLLVKNIRQAMSEASRLLYGDPSAHLDVVGITGTNGKTTTSYMTRTALDGAGAHTAVIGTLGAYFESVYFPATHTTPEADQLNRIAAQVLQHGATHLVMEVSSHALAQQRADSLRFRVAAFTNLTQDHLDYHGTLQAYAAAKDRLFFDLKPETAVIMIDDPHGKKLSDRIEQMHQPTQCFRVSTSDSINADICPVGNVRFEARGLGCKLRTPDETVALFAPFVGKHNLANLLVTIGIGYALHMPVDKMVSALSHAPAVPGRLERCDSSDDDIAVFVDYAHTPDALQRAIQAVSYGSSGQLTCVFGCGGDRDKSKRALMGKVAATLCDVAIVTNDNPRTESPQAIANDIVAGMHNAKARWHVQLDRAKAIDEAIMEARSGDTVLIAGKGHEPYQLIGDQVHHFDDRHHARNSLRYRKTSPLSRHSIPPSHQSIAGKKD